MELHDRQHLRAVVAIWLTNWGAAPVDGANDPRALVDNDYEGAAETTRKLVEDGYLDNASGSRRSATLSRDDLQVWPSAKGVFEAIS